MRTPRFALAVGCLCVAFITLSFGGPSRAQTSGDAVLSVQDLLLHAEKNQQSARRAMSETPDLVAAETDRVMEELDRFFQIEVQELLDAHHVEAKAVLQKVGLPEDIGNMGLTWRQWWALVDDQEIKKLVENFVTSAQRELDGPRERLIDEIDTRLDEVLSVELKHSLEVIRDRYRQILNLHFGDGGLLQTYEFLGILPDSPEEFSSEGLPDGQSLGVIGGLAALVFLLRRRIRNVVVKSMIGKLLGRAAGAAVAFVPIVGTIVAAVLLAWDVIGIFDAKEDMEADLRARFLGEYTQIMTVSAIWSPDGQETENSVHQEVNGLVRDHLRIWGDEAKDDAEQVIEAARVFALSSTARDYIADQLTKGHDREEIFQSLSSAMSVYPADMIAAAPIDTLLMMIAHTPDREVLSRLADELDVQLVGEYRDHGRRVLIAASRLGASIFVEIVNDDELDWNDVANLFERYPVDMEERARKGLLLALRNDVEDAGIPLLTLENIHLHAELFEVVAPVVRPDKDKLYTLFRNREVLDVVRISFEDRPDVAAAFAAVWPARTWERYRDSRRLEALMAVADYRLSERREVAGDLARELEGSDSVLDLHIDIGLDGVRLWDAHAGPSASEHQRQRADRAIALYQGGVPLADLLTEKGLTRAIKEDESSGLLRMWYAFERRLYSLGDVIYYVAVAVVVAVGGILVWKRVRSAAPGNDRQAGRRSFARSISRRFDRLRGPE